MKLTDQSGRRRRCTHTHKGVETGIKYRCPKLATVIRHGVPRCDAHNPRNIVARQPTKQNPRGLTVRQAARAITEN